MIDLGAWASDAYSITGREVEGDDVLNGASSLIDENIGPHSKTH